ncbi:tRNA (adenosine(37)-N6)-threonylcarbamoyltransferase complex dimerization subunit type 1 TsaB [Aeromicrobium sp. CF4.19]|uniref:tRNA (adenosine(37)-N6)-threonylcarbamoyltransferase complex dimerization subunit type 1 TsaB n=1 Tax=Aeromicrobium sp. CF4.19 TaxID=3373082 RepID=UPI003EE564FD
MLLLALDTAGPVVTVAVHDGTRIVGEARGEGAMAHGELLAPAIRDALASAGRAVGELTDIAVGVGPGPFTGLRVGVVTALSLASTLRLTTHGVCSLDAVAPDRSDEHVVATDARRKEVYWAHYADGRRIDGPHVDKPATVATLHPDLPVVGRGAHLYADVLGRVTPEDAPLDPSAALLADLVATGRAARLPLEPLYLRRPDAKPAAPLVVPGAVAPAHLSE